MTARWTLQALKAFVLASAGCGASCQKLPSLVVPGPALPLDLAIRQTATNQETLPSVTLPVLMTRPSAGDHAGGNGIDFSTQTPTDQATHMIVGRSMFIDTRHRLTKVYITNPETLDSYTATPNQVVVTAKKPGVSTLVLWDEAGESKTYLIITDLNVEALRDSMKQIMPNEDVKVQANEGSIVISGTVGTAALSDAAAKLAGLYSKDVSNSLLVNSSRVKQVKLEVRVVEVDRSKMSSFAFNFFSAGGNNLGGTTTGQFPSTIAVTSTSGQKTALITNPLNFSLYSSKLNIGATLQDLETMQVLQILAEPNITTLSGQKANFLAGGEFPFPVIQSTSTGAPSVTIQFRPYGVKLEFTPIVNADGSIELKVAPEVSALDYTNAVVVAGYTIPALSTRRAETQVVLKSGQTFEISGLLDKRTTDQYAKTPGIASVPILGQLFKSKSVAHTNSDLIIIVTPTIVDPISMPISSAGDADPRSRGEPENVIPMLDPPTFDRKFAQRCKKTIRGNMSAKILHNSTYDAALITVCVDPDTADLILQAVEKMPWAVTSSNFESYISSARRPYFAAQISAAKACIAIVDFDLNPAQAVETTKYLQQLFAGKLTVIALAENRDPEILLQAMRAGCSEFLHKPYNSGELDGTLQRLERQWSDVAETASQAGSILTLLGVKGGVGTTTLAVHLAMSLVQIHKKRTLLIDLHPAMGHVCIYLGLEGGRSHYQDVVGSVTRLDTQLLRGMLAKHSSGLEVLSSPDVCGGNRHLDAEAVARTLEFLGSEYDYVVIDCPNSLDDTTIAVIEASASVYLVATPDIGAIRDLSRYVDYLMLTEGTTEKMQVVINRESSRYAVNVEHIETAIRLPVTIRLPNSYAELVRSANLGEPIQLNAKSEFTSHFVKWANTLVGSTGTVAETKKASSIFGMWNWSDATRGEKTRFDEPVRGS